MKDLLIEYSERVGRWTIWYKKEKVGTIFLARGSAFISVKHILPIKVLNFLSSERIRIQNLWYPILK